VPPDHDFHDSERLMTTNQQKPSPMPFHRYRAFPPVDLPDRTFGTATRR
jgi:2-isopropylmalate synthase